jgi:hypothetical protein
MSKVEAELEAWRTWAIDLTGAGLESDALYRDHIDWLLHYHRVEDDGNADPLDGMR